MSNLETAAVPADLRRLRGAWWPYLAGQAAVAPEEIAVLDAQLLTFTRMGCEVASYDDQLLWRCHLLFNGDA